MTKTKTTMARMKEMYIIVTILNESDVFTLYGMKRNSKIKDIVKNKVTIDI